MGLVKYLLALLLILIPATSLADTHNAASCSSADVTTAITAAASGDIVTIPPRDCSGTPWTTGVTIPSGKNITIQGAGYTNTIIAHSGCDAFNLNGTASRLTGIQIKHIPDTTGYGVVAFKTGWRIDHCYLNRNDDRDAGGALTYEYRAITTYRTGGGIQPDPITGLIDNNIIHGRIDLGGLNSAPAATEWTQPSHIGTENAVYVEDNVFNRIDCDHANVIDSNRGISYVARYNTITGHAQFMAHGTQLNTRGTRNWEIYGNNFVADKKVWMGPVTIMGGTGIVAFNTATGQWNNGAASPRFYPYVMNGCTGDYPCTDQVGRGKDQELDPAYLFSNFTGETLTVRWTRYGTVSHIQEDRDYYIQGSSFDGTSGVGCGTLANRPATCTTGVAYWATNQSNCSDLTGYVGDSTQRTSGIATKIEGSLYKCVANAWEETPSYTPYTYPHPLRTEEDAAPTVTSVYIYGSTTVINFSEAITSTSGAAFTVAGLDSAMTLTCPAVETAATSMTCTNSRTVYQSEGNGTYGYTGTKVIDAASNALATIDSSPTAVNMSTEIETPPALTLTISSHTGAVVTSSPSGLNCGSTCSADFENGTVVTVSGYCLQNYTTLAIGGDCASNGTVTVNGAKSCTATCTKISPDVVIGAGSAVTLGSGAVGTLY